MIISCTNCNKKFEINSDLIPDSGRLLVCGSCNNEWFYTNEKLVDETIQINKETSLTNNFTPASGSNFYSNFNIINIQDSFLGA